MFVVFIHLDDALKKLTHRLINITIEKVYNIEIKRNRFYTQLNALIAVIDFTEVGRQLRNIDINPIGAYLEYVYKELVPYLKRHKERPSATNKQKIVSMIFINKDQTVLRSVANLQDALDGVEDLTNAEI